MQPRKSNGGGGQEVRKKQLVNVVLRSCQAATGASLPYVRIGDFLFPFKGRVSGYLQDGSFSC